MKIFKHWRAFVLSSGLALAPIVSLANVPLDALERRVSYFPSQAKHWDRLQRRATGKITPLVESVQTSIKAMDSDNNTIAYVLVHKGKIIAENYKFGTNQNTPLYAYSVTKSAVGVMALLTMCDKGISADEKLGARSKRLKKTLWAEVSIRNAANMSSGIISNWRSNYKREHFVAMLLKKVTPLELLQAEKKARGREGRYHYSGYDTNALGIFVEDQNGQKISKVFERKIWKNMASTGHAYWQVSKNRENVSAVGLMMNARDWAQFGRYVIHLNKNDSCFRNSLSNAISNRVRSAEAGMGYAFQFWLPNGKGKQVEMLGVDGQRVFIDFEREAVLFVYSIKDRNLSRKGWSVIKSLEN